MEDNGPALPFGTDPNRYRSYLLRLWREAPGMPWRCQVQCVGSGRVLRFEAESRLFEFLEAELGHADGIGPAGEGNPSMAEDQAGVDGRQVGRTEQGLV
jgi:hypothetical protein